MRLCRSLTCKLCMRNWEAAKTSHAPGQSFPKHTTMTPTKLQLPSTGKPCWHFSDNTSPLESNDYRLHHCSLSVTTFITCQPPVLTLANNNLSAYTKRLHCIHLFPAVVWRGGVACWNTLLQFHLLAAWLQLMFCSV